MMGLDPMAYLKIESPLEQAVYAKVLMRAFEIWRHEFQIVIANGVGLAFGGK